MNVTPQKVILLLLSICFCSACLVAIWFFHWLNKPQAIPKENQSLVIKSGTSLYSLSEVFYENGLIAWPELWVTYARVKQRTGIKAGEYQLPGLASPVELLEILNRGDVVQHKITLIEGKTFREILSDIHAIPGIKKTLHDVDDAEIIQRLNIDIQHLEGWFFPDTYNWIAGDSDHDILLQAHAHMRKVLDEEWQGRAENLPYDSPYEALIMASIVEKETGVAYERDMIAGVFVRRLELGMRLATDPTVIYGMGDDYQGNIRRKDLKQATPYNTYVIKGLPPTPIAMAGREAIHAALHPKPGTALYFVAKGDGSHQFSATLEEHNKAVKQYQLTRKSNYRSSPKK